MNNEFDKKFLQKEKSIISENFYSKLLVNANVLNNHFKN